jgi:hypothetical protein
VEGHEPASGGKPRPTAPPYRPSWLLFLSSVTLIYGGLLLVSGLTSLRDPSSAARLPITQPQAPAQEVVTRKLQATNAEIVKEYGGAIRVRAAGSIVVALMMLYAAAAALSRDPRGRTVTLAAAWLGIVYQLGSLPIVISIARQYAARTAPLLVELVAIEGPTGGEAPRPEAMISFMRSLFVGTPIVLAALGIGGCLLLIAYFGGRRGRTLYGLD